MKKLLFFAVLLNLVTHVWSSTSELKELMRQSQPFDRGVPLSASVDALITSKKGKETLMKYNMYTLRGEGKINVMIAFSAPNPSTEHEFLPQFQKKVVYLEFPSSLSHSLPL